MTDNCSNVVQPVDVALAAGYTHEEFNELFAGAKLRIAHLIYSGLYTSRSDLNDINEY